MTQQENTRYTLLQKIQDPNNENSWDEFVQYYSGYIYVIIRNFHLSAEDSEDLLQDVLIKLWKGISTFDLENRRSMFRTWLCSVVRNTVLNYLSSKKYRNSQKTDHYEVALNQLNHITEAEVDEMAEKEWKNYVANMAWNNIKNDLTPLMRDFFEASIDPKIDPSQIPQMFNISEGSVRVYRSRIRKAMSKEIIRLESELG